MKKIMTSVSLIVMVFVLQACQSDNQQGALVGSITAVGSSALQPLVESAAETFQEKYPDVYVNVQGGGSGQGLSQIVAGTVEIGNSDIFAQEKKIDIEQYKIVDNKVAAVGVGVIVNKQSQITDLTREQMIAIFTGKVTNWKEVGGSDLPIVVINRASGSGTRAIFKKYGLDNVEPMTAQEQDNSGTVRKLVAQTQGAISYVAFSHFNDQHYTAVSIDGVKPTRENVETNDWKIWAYEHMYISKDADVITKTFLEHMLSDAVQDEIIGQLGYIPVKTMKIDRDVNGVVTPK